MTTRIPLAAAAALALAACSPDFDPASKVDKLRVLAIQAEPPEIEPTSDSTVAPDRATLRSLVLDAEPAGTTTVVHLACVPTPGEPTPSPCVVFAALRDPTVMLAQAAQASCDPGHATSAAGVAFAGVEVCAAGVCGPALAAGLPLPTPQVAIPDGFAFPPAGPERILGVQAIDLAFALDATPDELVAGAGTTTCWIGEMAARFAELWSSREHVLSTKRIQIRGPAAPDPPNVNPAIAGIKARGAELDAEAATTLAGGTIALTPIPDPLVLPQPYTKLDAAGAVIESTTEEWVYSWFSTAGDLDELHTHGTDPDEWTVSASAGGTPAIVAAVVRDLRGGEAWTVCRVVVAP